MNILYSSKVFDGLRSQTKHGGEQGVFEKLTPIAGDITLPALGISATDAKVLCENVQIVFHSAATIKFNEDLKSAVEMNLKGTQRMVDLARQMRRLEVCSFIAALTSKVDSFC
jgi:alcohol-forming fatty acyl-CoA reductase